MRSINAFNLHLRHRRKLFMAAMTLLLACSADTSDFRVDAGPTAVQKGGEQSAGQGGSDLDPTVRDGGNDNTAVSGRDGGDDVRPTRPPVMVDAGSDSGEPTDAGAVVCRTDKMMFDQDDGCANDGFIEFCTMNASETNLDMLESLVDGLNCQVGSSGRAGCMALGEALCMIPVSGCNDWYDRLSDEMWALACEFSAMRDVRVMANTIYE